MNKNWKSYWKVLTLENKNEARHHFQYCVLKALNAKANNKVEIALALLRRAFTPVTNTMALTNGRTPFDTVQILASREFHWWTRSYATERTIFGFDKTLFFNDETEKQYIELIKAVAGGQIVAFCSSTIRDSEPDYLFLFVRQDISKEQQAVQATHAAYKGGTKFRACPDKTNFVLIGVETEQQLEEAIMLCAEHEHDVVDFREPDLGDTLTAFAVRPMKEHQKRFLKRYKKLEFQA